MRQVPGSLARYAGFAGWGVAGLSALVVGLELARQAAGLWGVVAASAVLPLTLAAAPWYALVVWKTWLPLALVYGGGTLATALVLASNPTS
jgi:hypothetical protein